MTKYAPKTADDKNAAWQPGEVARTLKRRKELDGATKQAVDLRLELDELEDRFGISSSVAMLRIKAGTLQMPAWERMYAEYRELIRWKP